MAKATTFEQPCFFPPLVSQFGPQSVRPEMPELRKSVTVPLKGLDAQLLTCWLHSENVDLVSLLRTAWAVVLRAYTSGYHICCGLVDCEKDKGPANDGPGLRKHIKVYESTITSLTSTQGLHHHGEHSNASESFEFITADDSLPAHSWPFNSIVYIDCNDLRNGAGSSYMSLTSMCREGLSEFQIIVRLCRDESTGLLSSVIDYTTTVLSHEQAQAVAETLNKPISEFDIKRLVRWNQAPLSMPRLEQCAFQSISRRCVEQPDATAVSAWDGELTYGELHQRSSTLAAHLAELGLGSGVFVPLFFEKSKWAVVALLGVIKAGDAFILIDTSYPLKRIPAICQPVCAKVAVVSPKQQ
ncbi:putative nonribosomal peptide synthase [Aspergillus bombycis]|uniref:Putative nonribosomal peptide synthase n=1 Tax=Aspergillus bombycis TaxID=109264 RepID=A0A1F7ZPR5_9EURO|nr:putative nonribosomal peptide synthase [Aspergillus bombycis]OGM41098.1 putative nonribosomal peptide synthase [Aspergillus bombycis]